MDARTSAPELREGLRRLALFGPAARAMAIADAAEAEAEHRAGTNAERHDAERERES